MASSRLKLNEDKMQIIWLGTCQQLDKVMVQTLRLPNTTVSFSSVVNNLGVLLDSRLNIADDIAALSRSCFCTHLTSLDRTWLLTSARMSVKCVYCDKTIAPSAKSSIMTNRKLPTSFPMS